VILLDPRYFRSPLRPTDERGTPGKERCLPDPDPAKTKLDDAQWRWLDERLREPAEIRIIVAWLYAMAPVKPRHEAILRISERAGQ